MNEDAWQIAALGVVVVPWAVIALVAIIRGYSITIFREDRAVQLARKAADDDD